MKPRSLLGLSTPPMTLPVMGEGASLLVFSSAMSVLEPVLALPMDSSRDKGRTRPVTEEGSLSGGGGGGVAGGDWKKGE